VDGIAGDPARIFGRQEANDAADIVGLRKTLPCRLYLLAPAYLI
jgi:hypothetical protein